MTDPRILTPEEVETYWDSDALLSAADIAQSHKALRAKLTEAERELAAIDAVLARRPALDKPTRRENIEHAINTAKRADTAERERDEARAKLATVEAERDRFQEWARGNRDEAEKAWARCHNAEAALAQMREALRDPTAVHAMLLRGDIARPSEANLRHLYPEWEQAESRCAALKQALVKVRAHTSYSFDESHGKDARIALLNGLLASIERIVDAALATDAPATPPATGDE